MAKDESPGSSPPIPDPTTLTTEQMLRAVGGERDYVNGQLDVLRERLDGIDRATSLLNETVNRVPTDVQKEVAHLRELDERAFESIALQFAERDVRQERESRDNTKAVDAAFAASKEASAKSEATVLEAIAKLEQLTETNNRALADKIDDVKDRVGRVESVKAGGQQAYAGIYALAGFVAVVIAIVIAVAAYKP